jgi:hypothetical protein
MKMSKTYAKGILDLWKDKTPLFNGSVTEGQFETYLKIKGIDLEMRMVILTALVMAGAKFAN